MYNSYITALCVSDGDGPTVCIGNSMHGKSKIRQCFAFTFFPCALPADGQASQLFYVRPTSGHQTWDPLRAAQLMYMLESAVQRRFPKGLKVHVHLITGTSFLADLTQAFKANRLYVTRAKVRSFDNLGHTFYLTNPDGSIPNQRRVQQVGGAAHEQWTGGG